MDELEIGLGAQLIQLRDIGAAHKFPVLLIRRLNSPNRSLIIGKIVSASTTCIYGPGRIAPEEVGKFPVIVTIMNDKIGPLARFQRSAFAAAPQTVSGVDGSRGDGLLRRHFQLGGR